MGIMLARILPGLIYNQIILQAMHFVVKIAIYIPLDKLCLQICKLSFQKDENSIRCYQRIFLRENLQE